MPSPEALLGAMFDAAVASAQPAVCVPAHLPDRPNGRTVVVGAGKASAAMARAVEKHWEGPIDGVVVTRYGHSVCMDASLDARSDLGVTVRQIAVLYPAFGAGLCARWP